MTTLREAHTAAQAYWDTKKGATGKVMAMRAKKAVEGSGLSWDARVDSLTAADATRVLTNLRHYALNSRASYYSAFCRMVALAGKSTVDWPSAGAPPRRLRDPMKRDEAEALLGWFQRSEMPETADLLTVLLGTGMRVRSEALAWDAIRYYAHSGYAMIQGKGGHERLLPVAKAVGEIVEGQRAIAYKLLSYDAHLKRWHRGVEALGIQTRLPTPHAIRHLYATEAYERSGRNLHVVRELLGHADINTTARYIGVDMDELRKAAGA